MAYHPVHRLLQLFGYVRPMLQVFPHIEVIALIEDISAYSARFLPVAPASPGGIRGSIQGNRVESKSLAIYHKKEFLN